MLEFDMTETNGPSKLLVIESVYVVSTSYYIFNEGKQMRQYVRNCKL